MPQHHTQGSGVLSFTAAAVLCEISWSKIANQVILIQSDLDAGLTLQVLSVDFCILSLRIEFELVQCNPEPPSITRDIVRATVLLLPRPP